jgi:general secretion pathway protein D
VAGTVASLFGGKGGGAPVSILPVDSSNSVVIRGEPATVARAVQTILDLDKRAERVGDVQVVELQHASAEQLLPVLQQLAGIPAPSSSIAETPAAATEGATPALQALTIAPGPGRRATIVHAPGRNALVINADPETQRMLLDVVRKLDQRRPQVMVEAIVVEISDVAARNLGVQLALAGREGSRIPFTTTQFPTADTQLMPLLGGALLKDDDTSLGTAARNAALQSLLGVNGSLTGLAGETADLLFGAIITAVKSDTGSNLLSTPSILTLDNEKAKILVGQEVPITTGEVLGDANSNPFRTIERHNVGIQLEVTPQVTAAGITLRLRQEVSSVAGPVSENFNELVLNKREIETQVLVDDGAIVALGGLLDQADRNTVEKVPGLGDVPLLGGLFRSTARSRQKTNLMVFIRPTVIRDAAEAGRATAPRYDYMRQAQLQLGKRRSEAELDALLRDYLHALPPVAAPTPAPPKP